MATIKAIEGRSVHQIQSGQVIVDLCSVVKELVENSLDAGATAIEVRFKNNGLESIEVQDNGQGIAPDNFETVALKHYTSKLSTYDDLDTLQTFGFRGEALSSLCALSNFTIVTARAEDTPKGTRLEFESSGKLKNTAIVAGQKGTLVVVGNLFHNLPVRRRELEKTIKREYGKVLGLLNAYACISVNVKFTVSNQMAKGKKSIVFSTKSNSSTRENIANVFGAKTLNALVPLNLTLEMQPTDKPSKKWTAKKSKRNEEVLVSGHISRPVFGEGRQTPDRQMLFVNSRPCGLPQIAKVFNEVYKTFNVSQSPFVFADFKMDTNSYDVNVSPDKRTILLHDQNELLETLKASLTELFESEDQTVPQSQPILPKFSLRGQAAAIRINTLRSDSSGSHESNQYDRSEISEDHLEHDAEIARSSRNGIASPVKEDEAFKNTNNLLSSSSPNIVAQSLSQRFSRNSSHKEPVDGNVEDSDNYDGTGRSDEVERLSDGVEKRLSGVNERPAEPISMDDTISPSATPPQEPIPVLTPPSRPRPGIIQNAFDRMRPKRMPPEMATIKIGSEVTSSPIGSFARKRPNSQISGDSESNDRKRLRGTGFSKSLRAFAAPESQQDVISDAERTSSSGDESENEEISQDSVAPRSPSKSLEGDRHTQDLEDDGEDVDMVDEDSATAVEPPDGRDGCDSEYVDEEESKAQEQRRVEKLIHEAEEATQAAARPTEDNLKRASTLLRTSRRKDATTTLLQRVEWSIEKMEQHMTALSQSLEVSEERAQRHTAKSGTLANGQAGESAEERLSLTISKEDFAQMRVVGQFNLGFILAARPSAASSEQKDGTRRHDELFIIDQHASDEKYNFERLQAETVVQNQRMVKPRTLDLTAVEEEILLENPHVLEKNGFVVEVDTSGDEPIGQRCKLVSLPMSREVVFDTRDLEELVSLIADSPSSSSASNIPRPSKVRRMFAMRACRSSIMIGRTLTMKQMKRVLVHMGQIDKPWNCPHGRPTMRHLISLDALQPWEEGQGLAGLGDDDETEIDWEDYLG